MRKDLKNACKFLKNGYQKGEASPFLFMPSDRTRGDGHDLGHGKFHLDMRRNFFSLRVVKH